MDSFHVILLQTTKLLLMGQRERTGWFLERKSGGIPSNTQSQKEAPLGHQKWEPRLGWAVEAAGTEPGYLGSIAEVP